MVRCPFNGKKGSKCSVMARRRTRVTLLILDRWPSLGWRSWRCYSSLIMTLDDTGGLAGPVSCPPIPRVIHTSDGRRNTRRFVYFRTDAHTLVRCDLDILYVYTYVLPFSIFFFFFWWRLGLCSALMAHWRRGTRCGHVFDSNWLGSLVSGGNLFSFPHFSRQRPFDINLSFLLFLPLATFLLSFCVWCLQPPTLRISPFVFSVSS